MKDSTKKTMKDCAMCTDKTMTDEANDLEIVDIHGCKYFGQFVYNELLRFTIRERYEIMQKIIKTLKK